MDGLENNQITSQAARVMIATIGTQDPVSSKTGQPTAPLVMAYEERPQIVYLIPTAQRPGVRSSSYRNAEETKAAILEQFPGISVHIRPIDVSDPTDFGQISPELERVLRSIEEEIEKLPHHEVVVTPTSGTPQMRETVVRLLIGGFVRRARAYEVLDPSHVPGGSRIRPINLPPPASRREKVALFVDHENFGLRYVEANARKLLEIAREWGDVEVACVGASAWDSLIEQQSYARAGFDVYTFDSGEKGGQAADYGLLRIIAGTTEHRPEIDLYVIASQDEDFAHGLIPALEQGKKALFLRSRSTWNPSAGFKELMHRYPARVHIEAFECELVPPKSAAKPKGRSGQTKQSERTSVKPLSINTRTTVEYPTGNVRVGQTRIGMIVTNRPEGTIVDIEGTQVDLPRTEQIKTDTYEEGEKITVYVLRGAGTEGKPRFTVSRTHPGLLSGILELAVPEVRDGTVEIKEVRRRPGANSEVEVTTIANRLNAVACCVRRISLIAKTLGNRLERVRILEWSEALSPNDKAGTLRESSG